MKALFFLHSLGDDEILDPKNNIERLRRMRRINIKLSNHSNLVRRNKIVSLNDGRDFGKNI